MVLLPTTVVGSYVQPGWLVDRKNLKGRLPPRVRAREIWKIPDERLWIAPDCGMKYLARDVAFGKLQSMVRGTEIVRHELGG